MLETILGAVAIATVIITFSLCKAAGKSDRGLDHPERINLRGK
ncbi:hypothetical protein [Clostridium magnum]|uniref:Uncharacterized protein n=1 Tax=Clostridium magnum DSM 2767 TaxID=1121326 RepID=A0A161YF81_9CLOT|nr:hypothetical protein [Clostridium magnum]KZL88692.1 hypothetical protein CLMAG_59810 [Clostridium magnum DSM 2767]SHJ64236.1 hypothetical protein SAMN02745944_06278 [Clostridium magnum DSM 2767]